MNEEQLLMIRAEKIEKLKALPDSIERAALAMDLYGKDYMRQIRLLHERNEEENPPGSLAGAIRNVGDATEDLARVLGFYRMLSWLESLLIRMKRGKMRNPMTAPVTLNEDVLEMARRIVAASGDAERDLAHDAGADQVAAELLRLAALLADYPLDVLAAFAELGIEAPQTEESFKRMVDSIDTSTKAGRQLREVLTKR